MTNTPGTPSKAENASSATRDGVRVRDVVAGVDDEVGPQVGQGGHPRGLAALSGHQVQVADVDHPQRPVAGREHRHRDPAQRIRVALHEGRVGEPGGPYRTDDGRSASDGMHTSILA